MAHALRDKAAISGIGETAYTRGTSKSGLALQLEASLKAIEDAGLSPRDIDGIVPYFPGGGIAEDFIANLGLPDVTLSLFVPMGGATCVAAIQSAALSQLRSQFNQILGDLDMVGEQMRSFGTEGASAGTSASFRYTPPPLPRRLSQILLLGELAIQIGL